MVCKLVVGLKQVFENTVIDICNFYVIERILVSVH